ncbi:hypothetical protein [Brevibacillus massiliensis]|uniref:hypothetical protein n=1 Tax=Brevibacillus massiliensis TaxID=1118054 RepID=UPI0002F207FB|nr:hypothetical protein [Brevibacillus massiliensis]
MKYLRCYLLFFCLTAGFLVGFSSPETPKKATWIWQTELIETKKAEILTFAEENGVNLIYLRIDPQRAYSYYQPFIREANAAGIEIHALGGHPLWALQAHRERILHLLDWVKNYNKTAGSDEQIIGVHLDIKPYLLPEWNEDKPSVLSQWMGNIEAVTAAARKDAQLEVSADLPVWLDDTFVPDDPDATISKWMISKLDHITLLAYRNALDGPNGIAALVENELREADELGKPVIIAVNTKESPGERHTSFFDAGAEEMERQLALLPERLGSSHPSYAGNAVHDYVNWKKLAPGKKKLKRGTYIWQAELVISEPEKILAFAKSHAINLLYVRLDLQQPYEAYSEFVGKAAAAGIEVHALGGHPGWALEENRDRMLKLVHYVQAYNHSVAKNQQFRGIHLDIEPYVLPDWYEDTDSVLRQWMDNIEAFVAEAKQEGDLEVSCDLAFWLDGTSVPGDPDMSFSKWIIKQLDHVTIMAFRNYAGGRGGIVHLVEEEIGYANELGKELIVAVEMKQSHEGEFVSFYEYGKAEMERQLAIVTEQLSKQPSYGGNVVHAYDYWKNAKE